MDLTPAQQVARERAMERSRAAFGPLTDTDVSIIVTTLRAYEARTTVTES